MPLLALRQNALAHPCSRLSCHIGSGGGGGGTWRRGNAKQSHQATLSNGRCAPKQATRPPLTDNGCNAIINEPPESSFGWELLDKRGWRPKAGDLGLMLTQRCPWRADELRCRPPLQASASTPVKSTEPTTFTGMHADTEASAFRFRLRTQSRLHDPWIWRQGLTTNIKPLATFPSSWHSGRAAANRTRSGKGAQRCPILPQCAYKPRRPPTAWPKRERGLRQPTFLLALLLRPPRGVPDDIWAPPVAAMPSINGIPHWAKFPLARRPTSLDSPGGRPIGEVAPTALGTHPPAARDLAAYLWILKHHMAEDVTHPPGLRHQVLSVARQTQDPIAGVIL